MSDSLCQGCTNNYALYSMPILIGTYIIFASLQILKFQLTDTIKAICFRLVVDIAKYMHTNRVNNHTT